MMKNNKIVKIIFSAFFLISILIPQNVQSAGASSNGGSTNQNQSGGSSCGGWYSDPAKRRWCRVPSFMLKITLAYVGPYTNGEGKNETGILEKSFYYEQYTGDTGIDGTVIKWRTNFNTSNGQSKWKSGNNTITAVTDPFETGFGSSFNNDGASVKGVFGRFNGKKYDAVLEEKGLIRKTSSNWFLTDNNALNINANGSNGINKTLVSGTDPKIKFYEILYYLLTKDKSTEVNDSRIPNEYKLAYNTLAKPTSTNQDTEAFVQWYQGISDEVQKLSHYRIFIEPVFGVWANKTQKSNNRLVYYGTAKAIAQKKNLAESSSKSIWKAVAITQSASPITLTNLTGAASGKNALDGHGYVLVSALLGNRCDPTSACCWNSKGVYDVHSDGEYKATNYKCTNYNPDTGKCNDTKKPTLTECVDTPNVDCSDTKSKATCTGDTGTTAIFKENDNLKECTLNKGNNSGFTIVESSETNEYCSVACKDDYTFELPTKKKAIAGQYFILNNSVPKTTLKRTCVTSKIDTAKFKEDLTDIQEELIDAYESWKDSEEDSDEDKNNYNSLQAKYIDTIAKYNKCYSWGTTVQNIKTTAKGDGTNTLQSSGDMEPSASNKSSFSPKLEFKDQDKALKEFLDGYNYTSLDVNTEDSVLTYFTAEPNNTYSNGISGTLPTENLEVYSCSSSGGNYCTTKFNLKINTASYLKRVETIHVTYNLPNLYTSLPSGKVLLNSPSNGNVISLDANSVPIDINTKADTYNYYLTFSNIKDTLRSSKASINTDDNIEARIKDGVFSTSGMKYTCDYTVKNDIYNPPGGSEPAGITYFYRVIDKGNINPAGRTLGYNWSDARAATVIDRLKDTETDYQKLSGRKTLASSAAGNNTSDVFSFTLTPTTMKAIRNYNKSRNAVDGGYSDWNLRCTDYDGNSSSKNGYHCYSNFLRCLASGGSSNETGIAISCNSIFGSTLNNYSELSSYGLNDLNENRERLITKQNTLDERW